MPTNETLSIEWVAAKVQSRPGCGMHRLDQCAFAIRLHAEEHTLRLRHAQGIGQHHLGIPGRGQLVELEFTVEKLLAHPVHSRIECLPGISPHECQHARELKRLRFVVNAENVEEMKRRPHLDGPFSARQSKDRPGNFWRRIRRPDPA
jgi:hypothetical protein